MFKRSQEPIEVVVADGRYEMYAPNPSPRSLKLAKVLKELGGVNESVPNGRYHFNVTRHGFKYIATLVPYK